jgi:hypothetical protein
MAYFLVGLGRIELPTSPLSGVRSSHLSYRPVGTKPTAASTGGAGRDRTGDLLNANQALSQLSYSPLARDRRACRPSLSAGNLQACRTASVTPLRTGWLNDKPDLFVFAELPAWKLNRGQLDAGARGARPLAALETSSPLKWRSEAGFWPVAHIKTEALIRTNPTNVVEWNGYFLLAGAVHSSVFGFPKLHPRSLLERR